MWLGFWAATLDTIHYKEPILSECTNHILGLHVLPVLNFCSIIGTGKKRALIDTGEPDVPEYIDSLKQVMKEHDISLSKILITHWHPDHIGGTWGVLQHVADKGLLYKMKYLGDANLNLIWPTPDCKVYKYKNTRNDPIFSDLFELNYLKDEEEIEVEGATVKMHLTPGHAKDHLAMYLKEEDTLFSGDCVLGEGSVVFEDLSSYLKSLEKILSLNAKKLYPGHGPVVEDPVWKVNDYIDKRMAREKQIVDCLAKTDGYMTSMDIVKATYDVSGQSNYHLNVNFNLSFFTSASTTIVDVWRRV